MKRPITCTACYQSFASWPLWLEHRAIIRSWEMGRYDNHTRRCLSLHDWAMLVLAEAMGAQEEAQLHAESSINAREGITV